METLLLASECIKATLPNDLRLPFFKHSPVYSVLLNKHMEKALSFKNLHMKKLERLSRSLLREGKVKLYFHISFILDLGNQLIEACMACMAKL